jgi:quercetin dioxygenase-like cupin family protein
LNALIEYDGKWFFPKVLIDQPEYRMVLLSMRKGQRVPEHPLKGRPPVYDIL